MTMEFGAITRGRGKIFQLIRTDCPAGHTLRATSELAGGRAMPAFVVPGRRAGERVLVLAVMAKAQRVTVELVDPEGRVAERKAETIGHAYAALHSKYNTYRKDPDALGIRNIDCRPMLEESLMGAGPLVEDGDGWVTVFCDATTYLSGDAPADTPFTITVFDQKGEAIGQGEPIVLKDAVRRPAGAQVWERRIQYSFRAPQAAPAYLAWLHYDDPAVPDGILCIEGNWANDLKGMWEARLADRPDAPGYEAWFVKHGRAGTAELARQRATVFADGPLFSIIVPLYQTPLSYFWDMVESVLAQTYGKYELVLVNASPEDAELAAAVAQAQARDPRVRVVYYQGGWNFSKIGNYGFGQAQGDYLLMLNNDTEVITPEWLHLMMGPLMRDEVGITGAKLLYPNAHVQHVGVNITAIGAMHPLPFLPDSDGGPFGVALVEHAVSAVTGACLLVKRSVFDAVGGLDEDFAVSYNDIDFCLKCCKLGKYVVMQPRAKLYHHESVTRGEADKNPGEAVQWFEEKALMMSRWADIYAQGDPFYNANLDRYRNAYELPR